MTRIRTCTAASLALLVAACATTPPAPVEDRSRPGSRPRPSAPATSAPRAPSPAPGGVHRVQRGDTLYGIAFRNGMDVRELARINRIGPPYTIYVGQEIRLGEAPPRPVAAAPSRTVAPPPAASATRPVQPAPPPSASAPSSTTAPRPGTSVTQAPPPSVSPPVAPTNPPVVAAPPAAVSPPPPAAAASASGIRWQWPAEGARLSGFVAGDPTRQGIDISGRAGDPVRAAADGEVVYSGNGLIGYGELIIIKHNTSLLSAYGHNRRRLVQEGDKVKLGQQIAEMGSTSASRDMLHFEIRKDGKPVDPAAFLPRR